MVEWITVVTALLRPFPVCGLSRSGSAFFAQSGDTGTLNASHHSGGNPGIVGRGGSSGTVFVFGAAGSAAETYCENYGNLIITAE